MPFERILERVKFSPWFCTLGAYASVVAVTDAVLDRTRTGGNIDPRGEGFSLSDMQSRKPMSIDRDGIASIHILGTLGRGLAPIEKMCGRTDYQELESETREASSKARAILYEFDSPGGSAIGVDQTAKIMANASVPTASYTESGMHSAAYYLGAGTNFISIGSGASMGSIGTVLPWQDLSSMVALQGRIPRTFTNAGADLKGISPEVPLTKSQEVYLQDLVDTLGGLFRSHIEDYRSPDEEVFRAGTFIGENAVRVGLADAVGGEAAARNHLLTVLSR